MEPGGKAPGPARGAPGSPNTRNVRFQGPGCRGLTPRAVHTRSQGSYSARAGTRPGAAAPSYACLTLLGYSKPDPAAPGRPGSEFRCRLRSGGSGSLLPPSLPPPLRGSQRNVMAHGSRRLDGRLPRPHTSCITSKMCKGTPASHPPPPPPPARLLLVPGGGSCSEGACVCVRRGGRRRFPWIPRVGWERRPHSPLPNTQAKRLLAGDSARPLPTHTPSHLPTRRELRLRNPRSRPGGMGRDGERTEGKGTGGRVG